ncbi:hypothetical protein PPYR_11617 [Photinus pyralis]|uniref:Ion transport domain-containing protein n=2 Tax=Photinus pyralis TaxID=7054 RepID=A0A5N4AC01_PHOPY|nr:uncharacterized protein LOC116176087 [Photinus pyralis]KAB0794778.1 hypothetical protein PPYR_11617 [Photinus pyralis]
MGKSLSKRCSTRKNKLQESGSTLDRVISQASIQDGCFLYNLANYKRGGELIDAYNVGGIVEVEKLIREQFGQLMYQDGKGQIINRAEYLRWKFRDHQQVVLPIEASLSPHDPLAHWTDHEACWQMQYRGALGESLLHVLIMCDSKIHTKLARTLIRCFPRLSVDIVEGEEYLGASALHLAIAYSNNELVQDLIETGANVNQRATGSFFLPRDQQRLWPAKHTDYEGLAYLGEYPLAWSACCANESVYNLLLDSGANPDLQDNFGNMILHMVVVCDKLDMFGYALRHPKLPASNGIVNKSGLSPLTLACKLGRAEVFREMLELSSKEFWRYSNITCSGYTLNALDTLLPDGRTNWNSALFIILNGTKQEHLNMLDGGIIQRLLEEKWKTFVRKQFLKRLLIFIIHLILLSMAVYLRPEDPDEPLLQATDDGVVICRYVAEIGTILAVVYYVVIQQGDEIKNQGFWTFLKQQVHSPAKAIFLISNLLILACIPFRIYRDKKTEEAILAFAVPGSWFLLMFFAGAVRLTGPFVTMIYSMITGDMLTFGIIYTIVLFGFSQSFYFLYKGFPNLKNSLYNSYTSTWMALFQITLGNYDYQELAQTTYPSVSKSVFIIFMVFVPILLLNMLIAMMGNTYAHVIEQSEKEYTKQWAKIVVTLERAIPQADAHRYLQEYSISLGPSEDPSVEQRAVMVIKLKSKTKAKQRKGSVANWKRVGKVTINALRKRGMTGEELRCQMWGRESITSPVKVKKARIDPLTDPQGPNVTGAFGEALTTTLDIMAFTHDLDIGGAAQGLNLANNSKPEPEKSVSIQTENKAITKQVRISNEPQGPSATQPPIILQCNNQPTVSDDVITTDPLRELVLCSKNYEAEPEKLNHLAVQAANLSVTEEITLKPPAASGVQAIAGIFTGTDTLLKTVETIKKRFVALDPSDSEEFGDAPLLGKISRTRRAKSACKRHFSAKSKTSSRTTLLNLHTSSSESLEHEHVTVDLDYAEERIREVRQSQMVDNENLRPYNIDVAVANDKLSVTISETMNIKEEGSGVELQSGNNVERKRKKRAKTAKANRVVPSVDVGRSCYSANRKDQSPPESPDPLEPWSTKNIANMNTILAWEDEHDSI